jgi:alkylation response protein AidB-like acyl-CoA dehydrogenase
LSRIQYTQTPAQKHAKAGKLSIDAILDRIYQSILVGGHMFELTPEQRDIKQAAREFAEKEFVKDVARELDDKEQFDDRIWKKAAELGFLGMFIEEQYGGAGLGHFEQCLVIEEFARMDTGIAQCMVASYFGTQLIKLFGTEAQKQHYLRPVCEGRWRAGMASTEPDAGSDVAAITTAAVKDGDDYVISGNKMFITNGTVGNFLLVLCVTDPKNPKKHERLSTILVETDRPGYEANQLHGKLSIRCSDTCEVDPALIAMAKWYTCEIAVKVADEAIQLHGGYGILKEYDVEHYWRDAKVLGIFEGTKEVEKVLIGKKLLQRS